MVNIESLKFGYRKGHYLFDDLNLKLRPGCVYGLFGVNGAGKTTLIRHIAGLLFPTLGRVTICDRESKRRDVETMRELFIIPEEFWLPSVSMKKHVAIHKEFYPSFDLDMFNKIIGEFEISEQTNLEHLSYGQKKKFMIAFGIASNCRLLLMDEPTNGLDIPSKSQFRKIMASYINEERCVLISTHQVRDLSSIIDHVIILDRGTIRFAESTETIMNSFGFGILSSPEDANFIYGEKVFGGMAGMFANKGKDTEIDYEILFNAVISDHANVMNNIQRRSL